MIHSSRRATLALALALVAASVATDAFGGRPVPPPPSDPAIAFCWNGSLKVMNEDGTNQVVLVQATSNTRRTRGVTSADPDWSPDGSQIVVASNVDDPNGGGLGVYILNRDGSGRHKIVSPIGSSYTIWGLTPSWSPVPVPGVGGNKYRIAYTAPAVAGGRQELWIADVDGSNPINLGGAAGADAFSPTWSPSGTRLACQIMGDTASEGRDRFGLMDFGAGGSMAFVDYPTPLSGHEVGRPSWSKTSESVMVVEANLGWPSGSTNWELWSLDPTNLAAAPTNLTNTASANEYHASHSPDSSRIVFQTAGVGIEIMNAGGTDRHVISSSGLFPAWRRNP